MDFRKVTSCLDRAGMTASTACAIHCALMPIAAIFLPLLGLTFLSNEWVEITMLCLSLVIGLTSLLTSYFKIHRNFSPVALFLLGFVMVIIGHFNGRQVVESIVLPIGGVLFVVAHYLNFRKGKCGEG